MLTNLLDLALSRPGTIKVAGDVTCRVAGSALATGFIFNTLQGVLAGLPGGPSKVALAQLLPGIPTWWVPESTGGVLAWGVILGLGVSTMLAGRYLHPEMKAF